MSEKGEIGTAHKNFCRLLYLLPSSLPRRGKAGGKGFIYRYVKLDDLIDVVKKIIHEQKLDLVLSQRLFSEGEGTYLETVFISSDASIVSSGPLLLSSSTGDPQRFGAVVTYMRRYQLQSLLGLAGEEDTDGR